jgi:hypothetical protein
MAKATEVFHHRASVARVEKESFDAGFDAEGGAQPSPVA